jgi:hypothetical protein
MSSAGTTEVELTRYAQPRVPEIESNRNESLDQVNAPSSLPPTDGGKDAWLFLFASFMLEALIWGRPALQFGRFQSATTSSDADQGSPHPTASSKNTIQHMTLLALATSPWSVLVQR